MSKLLFGSGKFVKRSLYAGIMMATGVSQAAVLEELVVTAQKREQNLQDVGISVTAYSGEQLKALGMTNTSDLQNMTPGLVISEFGGSPPVSIFSLRGVSQNDFGDHHESPNAVYLDGAYISNMAALGAQMFDVERVEVLRGPQGTLFGRNATGGLVHIISNKPTHEFEAYTDLTVAEYSQIKFEGAVNGSLTDTLAARLSVATNHHDAYIDNKGPGPDGPESASINVRLQFQYDPTEDLGIGLSLRHSKVDDVDGGIYDSEPALTDANGDVIANPSLADYQAFCGAVFGFVPTAGQNCFAEPIPDDPYDAFNDADGGLDRTHDGITLKIVKEFESFTLTSITDYQDVEKDYLEDSDSTVLLAGHFSQDQDSEQFSQELQVMGNSDDLNWVVGAYYLKLDGDFQTGFDMTQAWGARTDNQFSQEVESLAIFGQTEFTLSETLSATLGARWTRDEKEIDFNPSCTDDAAATDIFFLGCAFFFPDLTQVQNTGLEADQDDTDYAYKVQLDWRPDDGMLVYGSISRGNKGGGYSASSFALLDANQFEFDPEVLTSYEIGLKYDISDTTRFNGSVFYYDYKDHQAFTFENVATILINVDAQIVGADFELVSSPAEGWDVLLGVSVLDAEAEDVPLPSGQFEDQDLAFAPDVSVNAMIRKAWDAFGGEVAVQLDGTYVDERHLSTINHPGQEMDAYTVGNFRATYTSGNENWSVGLFVNNIGDVEIEHYRFDETFVSGTILRGIAPPRWAGLTASYRWD